MNFITDLQQTWADPQTRHAMIVHWPIVLSVLSLVFVLALAVTMGKNRALRVIALLMCLAAMISGYMGLNSGEHAESSVQVAAGPARDTLEEHEELAEKVPLLGTICAGLVAVSFLPKPPIVRKVSVWLALIACVITAGWVANTAHYGGQLVYAHGVGMPEANVTSNPPAVPNDSSSNFASTSSNPRIAFFEAHVKPILIDTCARCHNPSRARRSGGLDQTSHEALLQGGNSGAAIVIGKPEESLLVARVKLPADDDDRMPPSPRDPLTPEQVAAIEQWIRDGAAWQ
jgi:uncharacterized membrane protein